MAIEKIISFIPITSGIKKVKTAFPSTNPKLTPTLPKFLKIPAINPQNEYTPKTTGEAICATLTMPITIPIAVLDTALNLYAESRIAIVKKMLDQGENVLVTRLSSDKAREIKGRFPDSRFHERARALTLIKSPKELSGRGTILVMSAGTSDIPVAEEAAVTAEFMGNEVETLYDVGISGLHRILNHREKVMKASVVVVAGMEGALPSVVGGLVDKPVIAVPTSVGYGASFEGIAALLGMLNSCAAGVTVVNIDNGFGAGYAASVINRK